MLVKIGAIYDDNSFNIRGERPSGPVALFGFKFVINFFNSLLSDNNNNNNNKIFI